MAGAPEAIGTPGLSASITLRSIDGRPALLFDREGGSSAVTWSPSDDVVVVIGSHGPLDQLFAIAQSVVEVDQAAWEAATTIDRSRSDGCATMFFAEIDSISMVSRWRLSGHLSAAQRSNLMSGPILNPVRVLHVVGRLHHPVLFSKRPPIGPDLLQRTGCWRQLSTGSLAAAISASSAGFLRISR